MIHIQGLSKAYNKNIVLKSIDAHFEKGNITGILGPNGCGKTTLIKSILGMVKSDTGRIKVNAQLISEQGSYRDLIGYMPQNSHFPGHLTAREIFRMIEDLRDVDKVLKKQLVADFEIEKYFDRPIGQLSGGMRQKVSVVLAFMVKSKILILDEPTVGLDPLASVYLKTYIRTAASEGKAVILVTHMVAEVEQLVQNLYFLLDGSVLFSGELAKLKQKAGTKELDEALVHLMHKKNHNEK